jgi:GH15 family glucan-1,4-alpha-glucosidase
VAGPGAALWSGAPGAHPLAPTGAIVAAPTTSLPETAGGERNWDYRYSWVRDARLTMEARSVAARPDEANKFFAFLAVAAATQLRRGMDLQIIVRIGDHRDLSERELPHLAGWRDSRPVRIGNGVWRQLDPVTQQFFTAAADTAAGRWKEKDQGIWEIRDEARDFLSSKLMCWAALNRAIDIAPQLNALHRGPGMAAARDDIRAAILEQGWSEKAGAFTQAIGSDDLDASNLMLAITGFLPGDDPGMKATIDATAARLTDERGLVYRYLAHDGLPDEEGTFLLCTFWLAQAQALAGELVQATATFERAVAAVNYVGLLAEEIDPSSGEMIANFPQAFSHVGLINAAWAIGQAPGTCRRGRSGGGGRFWPGDGAHELTRGQERISSAGEDSPARASRPPAKTRSQGHRCGPAGESHHPVG